MTTAQLLQEHIIQKAWEDAVFKKQLIADPKAALKKAFGIEVPDTIEVEVLEESVNKFYFILPQSPKEVTSVNNSDGAAWQ